MIKKKKNPEDSNIFILVIVDVEKISLVLGIECTSVKNIVRINKLFKF